MEPLSRSKRATASKSPPWPRPRPLPCQTETAPSCAPLRKAGRLFWDKFHLRRYTRGMPYSAWMLTCLLLLGTAPAEPTTPSTPQESEAKGCLRCKKRGAIPCKQHNKHEHAMETEVLFCSVAAACEDCAGAMLVDCEYCEGGPDSSLIAPRRARNAAWMKNDPMQEFLGKHVPRIETPRFELIVNTGDLREGRKKVDEHTLMHRVAQDVMFVRSSMETHYGLPPEVSVEEARNSLDPPAEPKSGPEGPRVTTEEFYPAYLHKMRMWIWNTPADHRAVMSEYLHSGASGDFKMLGKKPVFSVWTESDFSTVSGVRSLFTHNAAHMLLSNMYKETWVGDLSGGWFDAGVGHWYEYQRFDRSVNMCSEEASLAQNYHNGVWKAALKKRLAKEEAYLLPSLLGHNVGAMELSEQALCWSFYDWLVAKHVDKLPDMLKRLKREQPARELLKEVFEKALFPIEDDWRAWVQETYPSKDPKRRR